MKTSLSPMRRVWLKIECGLLFIVLPILLHPYASRWNVLAALWAVTIGALIYLTRRPGFSWRKLWNGVGWKAAHKKRAVVHFLIAIPLIVLLTSFMASERMFSFPLHRPLLWLAVMMFYPLLSALPQELVFRSFFFQRYAGLFKSPAIMVFQSAAMFGAMHLVFGNWVAPVLSFLGGLIFAHSYRQHRSLKWVVIEHAAYGCLVFTIGIGFYFVIGSGHLPH